MELKYLLIPIALFSNNSSCNGEGGGVNPIADLCGCETCI
jgi:hypothetical protein